MNKTKAKTMFEEALSYCKENYPSELEWAEGTGKETFKKLTARSFLADYCWVIYASGFEVSTIEAVFPQLERAFKDFELDRLARMRSLAPVLAVFNNERKANCFLKGSKEIAEEGFPNFKKRLKAQGICVLEALPGIGPVTKYHLAKNIGLVDEAKPDIWLVRAAEACNTTVNELVAFLSEQYRMSRHVVDVVLWRHGADNKLGPPNG
jgi:3-methyladenine DNA glycosylase Tag